MSRLFQFVGFKSSALNASLCHLFRDPYCSCLLVSVSCIYSCRVCSARSVSGAVAPYPYCVTKKNSLRMTWMHVDPCDFRIGSVLIISGAFRIQSAHMCQAPVLSQVSQISAPTVLSRSDDIPSYGLRFVLYSSFPFLVASWPFKQVDSSTFRSLSAAIWPSPSFNFTLHL